jgi:dihydrofolate reductase
MRELTADLFISLDGYARGEGSPAYFGYDGPELQRWIVDELAKPQTVLLGRVTYELLSGMSQAGPQPMDDLPKLVVSNTLPEPLEWNATLLKGDAATAIENLKQTDGDPLRSMGSLTLVRSLLRARLVDRLRLMVFPLVLGESGREPFFAGLADLELELARQHTLDGRLVLLEYHPAS